MKTKECMREIRPLGFVIEFQPKSTVSDISPNTDQYGSSRCESAQVCAVSAQVDMSREEKKKKKRVGRDTNMQTTASLTHRCVKHGCGSFGSAPMLPSLEVEKPKQLKRRNPPCLGSWFEGHSGTLKVIPN